jgi:hypothetical protein
MRSKYSESGILKRERGEIKIDLEYIEDFCRALSIAGKEKARLIDLTKLFIVQFSPWSTAGKGVFELQLDYWKRLTGSEEFREYETNCICGLLQCQNYRYEMLRLHGIDHASSLAGAEQRADYTASFLSKSRHGEGTITKLVTDEEALYRVVGSKQVMIEQLNWLLSEELPPSIDHRILPRGTVLNVPLMYSFSIFDDVMILMETATGAVYSGSIEGIQWLEKVFDYVFSAAVGKRGALTLVERARDFYTTK